MNEKRIPPEILEQMIRDAASLKKEFFEHYVVLTASEVADLAGLSAEGADKSLKLWRAGSKVLSVKRGHQDVYPAFQFGENGQPLPIVHEVLKLFSQVASRTDWDNAIWFVAANGWLGGEIPCELLTSSPAKVKHAAEQEVLDDIE